MFNLMGFGEFRATEYSPLILWRIYAIVKNIFTRNRKNRKRKNITHMEAVIEHCRIQEIEPNHSFQTHHKSLKDKIKIMQEI